MNLTGKPFFTVKEIARLLRLNSLTIYEYIRSGRLSAIRFGRNYRVAKSDLSHFIDKQKVKHS